MGGRLSQPRPIQGGQEVPIPLLLVQLLRELSHLSRKDWIGRAAFGQSCRTLHVIAGLGPCGQVADRSASSLTAQSRGFGQSAVDAPLDAQTSIGKFRTLDTRLKVFERLVGLDCQLQAEAGPRKFGTQGVEFRA